MTPNGLSSSTPSAAPRSSRPTAVTDFQPPGPGGWKHLADHFPGALTQEYRRLYLETCPEGMARFMERYGVLAKTVAVGFVHGHLYITPEPLVGSREPAVTPPYAAVWLASRLHPAFRRRARAARRAIAERPWRHVATDWFASERAVWVSRCRAMQDEDPQALDTGDLGDHLRRCRTLAADGYLRHFELHGDDLLPVGLLIIRAAEWGIDAATAMRALDGASPISAATVEPPAWQLITGYDLDSLAWVELTNRPTIRAGIETPPAPLDLSPLVPAEERGELAELVADARAAVPLRDDNGAVIGAWPMGLLRRAMVEVGRRLGLSPPTLAVEATVDELLLRLTGSDAPTEEHLAERGVERQTQSRLVAPATLGPDFAIPELTALPRDLALIGAAQLAASDHMLGSVASSPRPLASSEPTPPCSIVGAVGLGRSAYTGRAVVVDDPAVALSVMELGDVIVTRSTSPSWNSILSEAGALVTTSGGLLSHAAIIARELDLPAVIGAAGAFDLIETGMTITVEPEGQSGPSVQVASG